MLVQDECSRLPLYFQQDYVPVEADRIAKASTKWRDFLATQKGSMLMKRRLLVNRGMNEN